MSYEATSFNISANIKLYKSLIKHKPHIKIFIIFSAVLVFLARAIGSFRIGKIRSESVFDIRVSFPSRNKENIVFIGITNNDEIIVEKCFAGSNADEKIYAEIEGATAFRKAYDTSLIVQQISRTKVRMNYVYLERQILNFEIVRDFVSVRPMSGTINFNDLILREFSDLHETCLKYRDTLLEKYGDIEVELTFQHGDLNPSNVWISGSKIELIDFECFRYNSIYWLDYFRYAYSVYRFYHKLAPDKCYKRLELLCITEKERLSVAYLIFEELVRRHEENIRCDYEEHMLQLI